MISQNTTHGLPNLSLAYKWGYQCHYDALGMDPRALDMFGEETQNLGLKGIFQVFKAIINTYKDHTWLLDDISSLE